MSAFYGLPAALGGPAPGSLHELHGRLLHHDLDEETSSLHRLARLRPHFVRNWLAETLPSLWKMQGDIETHFPGLKLGRLVPGKTGDVSLRRSQIACLLSHMFLGTTQADDGIRYYANLRPWLSSSPFIEEDPRLAYVNSLLEYFERFFSSSEETQSETVTFARICGEDSELCGWESGVVKASCVTFPSEGSIGDRPSSEVQMDFANETIGFGATGTQEEILFGCSPELCVAPLLLPTLRHNEVALLRGAWVVCDSVGYGDRLRTERRRVDEDASQRWVLCVDATDLSDVAESERAELLKTPKKYAELVGEEGTRRREAAAVPRDCGKLFLAFKAAPPHLPIGTGKWGCGAFMGNVVLKAFLQVCMASAAQRQLNFYRLTGDDKVTLEKFLESLEGKPIPEAIQTVLTDLHMSDV